MAKSEDKDRIDIIEKDIEELKEVIDFLYSIIRPELPPLDEAHEDDGYDGPTAQIPVDVYKKIMEYVDNKNFLFMGVA